MTWLLLDAEPTSGCLAGTATGAAAGGFGLTAGGRGGCCGWGCSRTSGCCAAGAENGDGRCSAGGPSLEVATPGGGCWWDGCCAASPSGDLLSGAAGGGGLASAAALPAPSSGLRGLAGLRMPAALGPDSRGGVMGIAAAASASAPELDGDSGSCPLGARATMCDTCAAWKHDHNNAANRTQDWVTIRCLSLWNCCQAAYSPSVPSTLPTGFAPFITNWC